MSGYKQAVINDDAITFITFDGDDIDYQNGLLNTIDGMIIDEIDNQNPAILHLEQTFAPFGYRIGLNSLVDLEQQNQNSFCIGYYNNNIKAFLEILHSDTYIFPNYGSFSVELILKKETEINIISQYPYSDIFRTILEKTNVCSIYYTEVYGVEEVFNFLFPSGNIIKLPANLFLNKKRHLVVSWNVSQSQQNVYNARELIVVDGVVKYDNTIIYNGSFPNTNQTSSWFIGGNTGLVNATYNDRNTSPLYLDQFAIYNRGITEYEAISHYKKIYAYDDMIINDAAEDYFPMNEENNVNDWSIFNLANNNNGSYYGTLSSLERHYPSEDLLLESSSVAPKFLSYGAMCYFSKLNYYNTNIPWFNINTNFAIEFWFKTNENNIGTLLSIQDTLPSFIGLEITLNINNNVYKNGGLQAKIGDYVLNANNYDLTNIPIFYNNEKWHHVVFQKNDSLLALYINGELHSSLNTTSTMNIIHSGILFLMGDLSKTRYCRGQICKFARYTFPLQEQQIKARYSYSKIYRIKGIITLQGIPTKANIRVYNNFTGELLGETISDSITGYYDFDLANNNMIDIIVFDKNNSSVRTRAYSGIVPSGENDFPITI